MGKFNRDARETGRKNISIGVGYLSSASEYLNKVKALILGDPFVKSVKILREEALDDLGMLRMKLEMVDDNQLEMFELFYLEGGKFQVKKYSFHWQKSSGDLLERWDNANHYPEVENFTHHVHVGGISVVQPSEPMNCEKVLFIVSSEISHGITQNNTEISHGITRNGTEVSHGITRKLATERHGMVRKVSHGMARK
jgi:hypothetical protein